MPRGRAGRFDFSMKDGWRSAPTKAFQAVHAINPLPEPFLAMWPVDNIDLVDAKYVPQLSHRRSCAVPDRLEFKRVNDQT